MFIGIFIYMIVYCIKQYNLFQEATNYIKLHAVPTDIIASSEMRDHFDDLILESGLTINNKNTEYASFEEKNNIINGKYELALRGKYLSFVDYLKSLYEKKMLYKINLLSLKVNSLEEIDVKINVETLYEVK
jgi:hypothetical protein